ncbi:MAG TPA: TRAM domain-containing protein [Vicinamibacterales bacterium]|jgi:tRNA/tmRNA/rRNA uracil-C5-methylase (TrmA/RlmC/RlmD family)
MLSPGSVVELVVEKPATGGRMVARHDGLVVLVQAAIPGERVRALIDRTGQGLAYAMTVEVIEPSPDRRPGLRDWACGGNVYAHISYPRQLALKAEIVADALTRIARLPPERPIPITGSPERGYRMRARFHVRGRTMGFFREGSHTLCDPAATGQLLEETGGLLAELQDHLLGGRLAGVTEIELAENVPAAERALHVELDRPVTPMGLVELSRLPTVVGVSAGFGARGERGRPPVRRTVTAGGTPSVLDTIDLPAAHVQLQHHAQAFFQANRYLLSPLASRVVSLVPPGPVVDLYAGVGLFAASLAASGRTSVVAVEGDRAGAADLRANAAPYGASLVPVEMAVEQYLATRPVSGDTSIIVDPPRTGMSKEASSAIAGQKAGTVLYVSCDVATFARDARRLADAGYRLSHLEAFDLFPNTAHVEAVGVFTRHHAQ